MQPDSDLLGRDLSLNPQFLTILTCDIDNAQTASDQNTNKYENRDVYMF